MTGLKGVQFDLVDSLDEAQRFLSWLGQKRPNDAISIDTETGELPGNDRNDALSPWKGQLRLVQVGDGMQGWSIPWDTWKGVFYQGMNRYEGLIVCHNIAFEAKFFELHSSWKIPWHRSHDTMIMAQLLDPLGSGALKSLTAKYIDPYAAHLQDELSAGLAKNGWTWGTVPV
jgi:hypothetical protein